MQLVIFKIGGNVLNNPASLKEALVYFAELTEPAILVHGGGRKATEVLTEMGRKAVMINGRRITDAATLDVVTMVYAGLINTQVVAQLQSLGSDAIGLSGADAGAILAEKRAVREIDYGFAGDVVKVNGPLLDKLLRLGLSPVMCPITHDARGQLLNTNADTIANETAKAMAKRNHSVSLRYCFELPGVLRDIHDPSSVIKQLTSKNYAEYRAAGIISGGMIPKIDNAFDAVSSGVTEVVIADLQRQREGGGTRIAAD